MSPAQGLTLGLAGWGVISLGMVGCSWTRAPTIRVVDAAVVESSEDALTLSFQLDLSNPNDQPLRLGEFRYRLSIDWKPVFRGRRAAEATLSAKGTRQLAIPAVLAFDRMPGPPAGEGATDVDRQGGPEPVEVGYTLAGSLVYLSPGELSEILFDTGVRKPSVGFKENGRIRLHDVN